MQNLPIFSDINPNNIEHDLDDLLNKNRTKIECLLKQHNFSWNNLIFPFEEIEDELSKMWSPISHLNAVKSSDALRKAYNNCLPKLSEYYTEIAHNKALYDAVVTLSKSDEHDRFNKAQRKVIENELRDFKLAGVALSDDKKKEYAKLSKELSQLTSKFEENVLDATQGFIKHVTDEKQLSGLPQYAQQAAREAAKKRQLDGWAFTLEAPSYIAIIMHADDASLRKEMYYAYNTRASNQGPNAGKWDNSEVMEAIHKKRLELAKLLDFNNYAKLSLTTKMVKKPEKVLAFLNELVNASLPKAKEEYLALQAFAKQSLGMNKLNAWDVSYASEKLRQHRYNISQEELRPYFPEARVLSGLFAIVKKLFGINIKPLQDVDAWHPDVKAFALYDQHDNLCAMFYMDLYARENKRGGAWMDECRVRRKTQNGKVQNPVAYITCNFNGPVENKPALFTHDEVVTLFHEFGHGLQHMLTQIDYPEVSGINGIPWDAVEVASQFLENYSWQKEAMPFIAEHYETKAPLPDELFTKMHNAKNFQAAMLMMRQLEFSLFDFQLHMMDTPANTAQIQALLDKVRSEVAVVPVPEFNRFQHAFSHIFAGGYAAGYYSYKWAEVMAADAFSLFTEKGIFDPATSQSFLTTILQSGGAEEPLDLFVRFRGREPKIDALLKQDGIY